MTASETLRLYYKQLPKNADPNKYAFYLSKDLAKEYKKQTGYKRGLPFTYKGIPIRIL